MELTPFEFLARLGRSRAAIATTGCLRRITSSGPPTETRSAPTREKRHRRGMRGVLANRLRTAETPDLAAQGQSVSRKTGAEVPLTMAILRRRRRRLWRGDRRRRSGHLREGGLEHKDLLAQVQDPANGWQLYWVDVAHASYVYQPGTGIFSSFETPTTIALKSEWAAVMGLGGISSGTSPTTPSNPPRASSRRPTTHGCSTRIWPRSASGRA